MSRPWRIWAVFGIALAVLAGASGWISLEVLRLERAGIEARRRALLEENVRLALWRMDSALAPLIARETGRRYFEYAAFYPADRAYPHMFGAMERDEARLPSPLLSLASPSIRLHFQLGPGGDLTSPQVPPAAMRRVAEARFTTRERIETAAERLAELRPILVARDLTAALPLDPPPPPLPVRVPASGDRQPRAQGVAAIQRQRSASEYQARKGQQIIASNLLNAQMEEAPGNVTEGPLKPLWAGEALLLARRVSVNGEEYVQGAWLDWPAIRAWLLEAVEDLLPEATLEPASARADGEESRLLASLPVRLVAEGVPAAPPGGPSPTRIALAVAWACVLLAVAAVAVLLRGALSLSERRATFVSAVTHELRTPLTTFQMYAEMLAAGMVSGEEKRRRYLETLRTEAARLRHLVVNVLAFAQLERGRPDRPSVLAACEVLGAATDRLRHRAERAGMELLFHVPADVVKLGVRADAPAVARILFNLVDNACKYAAGAEDPRIHIELEAAHSRLLVRVRDHGPGIPRHAARRLFRPFSKSAREAAGTAPGVGLGLAISRRLARRMGGDLRLDGAAGEGACFVLILRMA